MEQAIFQQRLITAAEGALVFAGEFVTNHLPAEYQFLLFPNQSYDDNPLVSDEEVCPGESLPAKKFLGPFDVTQVVSYLWRNRKVPEWVNITVTACDDTYTYMELLCCGRFTAMDELLYHKQEGYPPFHVLSPNLPSGWDENKLKFDIYWHGRNPLHLLD